MLTIEQATEQQPTYKAREEFRRPLGGIVLSAFVGPTSVGKNFLMEKSGLPIVGTATTRPKRASDGPYCRYVSVEDALGKIERGEVVQYGAHDPNIYFSEQEDYVLDTPNVADIYYDSVYALKNEGFKKVQAISVLTDKAQWMSQLTERFEDMEAGAIIDRLDEARRSLRWIRNQQLGIRATNHLVVINLASNVTENIEKIRAFAHGSPQEQLEDEVVDRYIQGMEKAITILYGRLEPRTS